MNKITPSGTMICGHCGSAVTGKLDLISCESCGELYWSIENIANQISQYISKIEKFEKEIQKANEWYRYRKRKENFKI